jgi:AcrR family transcriptional regulator
MSNQNVFNGGGRLVVSQERELTIGQVAELVTHLTGQRCTTAMIYNYERLGLIDMLSRSPGGFRLFKLEDAARIVCIKRWQGQGMSLAEINERLEKGVENCEEEIRLIDLPMDRRAQILEAAAQVFPQKGYMKTTIQDIAQQAGVSNSAIYQYFNSKEELFLALTENISFMDVLEDISSSLNREDGIGLESIRQALIEVADAFLGVHHPNAEIIRMFIAESQRFPEIGMHYCQNLIAPLEAKLESYFARQVSHGVFRPVDVTIAVRSFYGAFVNILVAQDLLRGKDWHYFPGDESIPKFVDFFLQGILNDRDK